MNSFGVGLLAGVLAWAAGVPVPSIAAPAPRAEARARPAADPSIAAVLPFEDDNQTIFVRARIGGRLTWVIVDTGDRYTVVDIDLARAAGVPLGDPVQVSGGGDDTMPGALAKGGSVQLADAAIPSLPIFIAIPLGAIAKASGHEVGGVIGYDFLSRYVTEVDYAQKRLILHPPGWRYAGPGQTLPIQFNGAGHPQVRAEVIERGAPLGEGLYTLDIGSAASLILNRPFVEAHHLGAGEGSTVPWLGGAAIGGAVQGRVGRVSAFRLGRYTIADPVAVFTTSTGGAFAVTEAQGNIGAKVLDRFRLFLDYGRRELSLEPTADLAQPIDYDKAGIVWTSSGPKYDTYVVEAVAPGSPAERAQIRPGDRLVAIDGKPVSGWRLSEVRRLLQRERTFVLRFERSGGAVSVRLRPRRMI